MEEDDHASEQQTHDVEVVLSLHREHLLLQYLDLD
jgi:hypothetical protein